MSSFVYNCFVCTYSRAINFVNKCVRPQTIDRLHERVIEVSDDPIYYRGGAFCAIALACFGCPITSVAAGLATYFLYKGKKFTAQFMLDVTDQNIEAVVRNSNKQGLPSSVLAIRSTFDFNGFLSSQLAIARYQKLASAYSIDMIRLTSKVSFPAQMAAHPGKYKILLIDSHANPEHLRLFADSALSVRSTKAIEWIKDRVEENGTIILQGCETGPEGGSIAEVISKQCPKVRVYATTDLLFSEGIYYDENCIPTFYLPADEKNEPKNITAIYLDGKLTQGRDPG